MPKPYIPPNRFTGAPRRLNVVCTRSVPTIVIDGGYAFYIRVTNFPQSRDCAILEDEYIDDGSTLGTIEDEVLRSSTLCPGGTYSGKA